MKICNQETCHLAAKEQDINNFEFRKDCQKYRDICKNCRSKNARQRLENNIQNSKRLNIPIQIKKCSNKDCLIEYDQYINPDDEQSDFHWRNSTNNYNSLCKNCILDEKKDYYINNKEDIAEYHKLYRQNPIVKEKIKIRNKKYIKDIEDKLHNNISGSINRMLKNNGSSKQRKSCFNYLEYTEKELIDYIELLFKLPGNEWMNWNNRGKYIAAKWNDNDPTTWIWNLDHIVPHSTFQYKNMECQEFKDCWKLSNLRPYSAKLNIKESNNRSEDEINQIKQDITNYLKGNNAK